MRMKKIVNPVMCEVYDGRARGFVKIEFVDGKLSVSGVIGPQRNGNCRGSAGQCVDEIREGEPADGWTQDMIIWDKWHLNNMRPYCSHQKELGWDKRATKIVKLYNYTLTVEALKKQNAAKDAAVNALKKGETFTPTPEQVKYAKMPYSLTTFSEISSEDMENYKPKKSLFPGDDGATSTKMLGWLRETEHPDGILSKPCPVCGYKYGSAWLKEEVPQEVIDWLFALPDATVTPAWV